MNLNMNKVNTFLLPISVMLTISLMIMLYSLPNRIGAEIKKSINNPNIELKDTTRTVVKVQTQLKDSKSGFYYLEGEVDGKSFLIEDDYTYNEEAPNDIYKGYFTKVITSDNTIFFVWSRKQISSNIKTIKGWFVNVKDLGSFQISSEKEDEQEYAEVLFAVTERN